MYMYTNNLYFMFNLLDYNENLHGEIETMGNIINLKKYDITIEGIKNNAKENLELMTALDLMISKEYQMKDRSKSLITYKKQKTTEISSSPIINFGETYKLQREVRNKEYRLIQESRKR